MIWKFLGVSGEEDFNISAQGWFKITIVAAAIGFLFFVLSGLAVLSQPDPDTKQKTSQAFAPFLVGIVATVTFFAAIWRGKLNSEQIRQQKRQNDAKDEENIAKLLLDGAKMLGEDKDSHVLAGISALQAVVVTPDSKFAPHAMDVLGDFIIENLANKTKPTALNAARLAVNHGARAGYITDRRIEIVSDDDDFPSLYLGFKAVKYMGGWVSQAHIKSLDREYGVNFENVKFDACDFTERLPKARNCEFLGCSFQTIGIVLIKNNVFDTCNFSGTKFTSLSENLPDNYKRSLKQLGEINCFYDINNPPTGLGIDDWSVFLEPQGHS
ncbi:hypothetical protein [Rhizobium sp. GR12]|uniref:hypothetical protein n=1 Tax=Rhizobium sp. GR12 TaxID=3053925 RepID=UPI002FBDAD5A